MINKIKKETVVQFKKLYNKDIDLDKIAINETPSEFEGNFTIVTFPLAKIAEAKPDEIADTIGKALQDSIEEIDSYNVVKGFLNIKLTDAYWIKFLNKEFENKKYGIHKSTGKKVMIEYGGPNTNKPLHLGHLRNILIGYATAEILKAAGNEVVKVSIYNDRGIHICKSMLAYQKFSKGETPTSSGIKGDHLVGDYYVKYETELKKQIVSATTKGMSLEDAKKKVPLAVDIQEMLVKWEQNDSTVKRVWEKMNSWVYKGFEETFKTIGCDFDKHYYESETYLLGKKVVEDGLNKKIFYKKEDGGVWIDLGKEALDQKLVLRPDGTSVYITQDLGTADLRYKDFKPDAMVYTVASEQDYHFKVLKLICERLKRPYAEGIYHLSYGMVELPTGRMKSREGTVVDADILIDEMEKTAAQNSKELGKISQFTEKEQKKLFHILGLGALKFFILRVDPKKKMLFNPEESIDFHGFTGPFIQYTHARICSLLRKAEDQKIDFTKKDKYKTLQPSEKKLIQILSQYPDIILESASKYDAALLANYIYKLAKEFNHFYAELSIMNTTSVDERLFRLKLSYFVSKTIHNGMKLLGIEVPDKM